MNILGSQILGIIVLSRDLFIRLVPYLLAGAILSEILRQTLWPEFLRRRCTGHPLAAIVSSGVYLCCMSSGNRFETKRIIFQK